MASLRKCEQSNWPQITPISKLNLIEQDLDEGPWAMAQMPMVFAKKNGILKEHEEDGKPGVKVVPGIAHRVFALQLGPAWSGPAALPVHAQALFAIFAARANRDADGANALIEQIALSSNSGKLDFSGVGKLLNKYQNSKLVALATQKHAYMLTIMASMLVLGRTDGVIASSEFLWLKPVDRKLWYMLNSVGRQTAVSEVAGPFAHWLAEIRVGRPMRVPMVDEAAKALEVAVEDILYEPEEVI